MARKFYTDLDFVNLSRLLNLPLPLLGGEPATKAYADGIAQGISWKNSVRVATTANVASIASPSTAVFDGVTLTAGDRILLKEQTDASKNGIYVFDTSSTPLVRSADANTASELKQAVVSVAEGTVNGGQTFRQSNTALVTIDTDSVSFEDFGAVVRAATQAAVDAGLENSTYVSPLTLANYAGSYSEVIGDGTATTFTITHNLDNEDVVVSVREVAGNKAEVYPEIRYTSANSATIIFVSAPAVGSHRVVVVQ